MTYNTKAVRCKWCEEPTPFQYTKECSYCYHLRGGLSHSPKAAIRMLKTLYPEHCLEIWGYDPAVGKDVTVTHVHNPEEKGDGS